MFETNFFKHKFFKNKAHFYSKHLFILRKIFRNMKFNPKLMIVDHFDFVKNQIDIRTETLLQQRHHLGESRRNVLNTLRDKQLKVIEQMQERNLSKYNEIGEQAFQLKWRPIIESTQLTYEDKFEIIKDICINFDCVLMFDEKYASGLSLWITPWYLDAKNVNNLR